MPKYFSHSLPYRRLQKFANGIWDENRKVFYPFKVANSVTVAAKRNIMYYVNSIHLSASSSGDTVLSYCRYSGKILGTTVVLCNLYIQGTVAASNVNAAQSIYVEPSVLCDPNSPLTWANTVGVYNGVIVYAEIPSDPAGGPVVVE